MKSIAIIALTLCIGVSLSQAGLIELKDALLSKLKGRDLLNVEPYKHDLRKRLGHFNEQPLNILYPLYAEAFIRPNHKERAADDYRNVQASAQECVLFLTNFRVNDYKLEDIHEIIPFDSCLGYLYESTYHEEDVKNDPQTAAQLQGFIKDNTLKTIYEGTIVHKLLDETKFQLGTFLANWAIARYQFSTDICNSFQIGLLNDFVELDKLLDEYHKKNDSYFKIIYELVKKSAIECYENEVNVINTVLTKEYIEVDVFSNRWVNALSNHKYRQQARERVWSETIWSFLLGLQGLKLKDKTHETNVRHLNTLLRNMLVPVVASPDATTADGEDELDNRKSQINPAAPHTKEVLRRIGEFATEYIKPKRKTELKNGNRDPKGTERYRQFVDDVCQFFRSKTDESAVDLYTPYREMIALTRHPELFGIDEKRFLNDVLIKDAQLTAPSYTAVVYCSVMTFTQGSFNSNVGKGKDPQYKVVFAANTVSIPYWPVLPWD